MSEEIKDILCHEECRSHQMDTAIVLPFEPNQFVGRSVEGIPGGEWPKRFWDLWNATPPAHRHVLGLPQTDNCGFRARASSNRRFTLPNAPNRRSNDIHPATSRTISQTRARYVMTLAINDTAPDF